MTPEPKRSPLGIIFLTVFVDIVGFSIIFPLFPDMLEYYFAREGSESVLGHLLQFLESIAGGEGAEAEFRTQVLFGGFLGSLYSVLQFICTPLWGRLSDRTGRKPVLLFTTAGLAVSYVVWFFSQPFLLLIGARLLGGIMSGNIAVASAAVVDCTDAKDRAKGMGMVGAALGLGFVFGPVIGAFLSRLDLTEYTDGAFGTHPFSAAAAGAFILSGWNWIWVQRRFTETLDLKHRDQAEKTARPINPLKLFHRFDYPGVNRTNVAYFVFLLAFAGMEFTLTFLAKNRFDYHGRNMAWIFVYVGSIIILVQGGVIGRVAPKYGEKRVALTGLLLLPAGLLLTGWSDTQLLFYSGLTFLAVGSALATPSMASLVSLYSPAERQGEIQGVFRSLGALSRAVGPIVACAMYFKFGPEMMYTAGAALIILPLLIARSLPEVRKMAEGQETGVENDE